MDMLLIGLCMTLMGLAVTAMVFAAATRPSLSAETDQPELPALKAAARPAQFFSDNLKPAIPLSSLVPIEVLLYQIENHVRLEQAAAESFVALPTQALLHSKTTSALVN